MMQGAPNRPDDIAASVFESGAEDKDQSASIERSALLRLLTYLAGHAPYRLFDDREEAWLT